MITPSRPIPEQRRQHQPHRLCRVRLLGAVRFPGDERSSPVRRRQHPQRPSQMETHWLDRIADGEYRYMEGAAKLESRKSLWLNDKLQEQSQAGCGRRGPFGHQLVGVTSYLTVVGV
jgi:hypothetical protein